MLSALTRLPLTVVLLVCAGFELALNRVGSKLLDGSASQLLQAIDRAGLFFFFLTGLLALVVFTWGVITFIRDPQLLRLPDRLVLAVAAALFLPLAALGQLIGLPLAAGSHLNAAFGLLLIALLTAFLRRPALLRHKLGVIYLCAPLLFHCFWLLTQQLPAAAPDGLQSELPFQLYAVGEHLVVVGALATFLFFAPLPRRQTLSAPLPLALALALTGALALALHRAYADIDQLIYHGLGINLPPPSLQLALYLLAVFFFLLTFFSLLWRSDPHRSLAIGLGLIAVSGYHLQLPYQLLVTLVGMMELMRAAMALHEQAVGSEAPPEIPSPSADAWSSYLRRLAAACAEPPQSGEFVVLQHEGQRVLHLRGSHAGWPFAVRLLHGRGRLLQLEVTVGELPREPAPSCLRRKRGARSGRIAGNGAGPASQLPQPALESEFTLQDMTGEGAALFSDSTLTVELLRRVHGWLGIWPGEAAQYLARPEVSGWPLPLAEVALSPELADTDELAALVRLLSRLLQKTR